MNNVDIPTGNGGRKSASWIALVIVALLAGGLVGYYLGQTGVGTGLVPEEDETEVQGLQSEIEVSGEEAPANPFDENTYENPFGE
jgi:hypothetical protein